MTTPLWAAPMILGLLTPLVCGVYLGRGLNHMAQDPTTGLLYVAGVNRLYTLDARLQVLAVVATGPLLDSPSCPPPLWPCTYSKEQTNNYNKLLVIDQAHRQLLTCGSVYQGACEARSLSNISDSQPYHGGSDVRDYAVAANRRNASTVGFIAPGTGQVNVLYVATTYTGRSEVDKVYRDEVPAISSRNIDDRKFSLAAITSSLQSLTSSVSLKREVASVYPIHYVAGFSSHGFSYFVTVQRQSVEDRASRNVSKIVQVCQSDPNYYSYADIPLRCRTDDLDYNEVQAAIKVRPSPTLAAQFNLDEEDDDLLAGLFSRRDDTTGRVDSAICLFPMRDIRAKFLENIKLCHQGNLSVSGGGYLGGGFTSNCQRQSGLVLHKIMDEHAYLCNTNLPTFSKVVGIIPMVRAPIIHYTGHLLTAIAMATVNDQSVAFIGTSNGHLKKLVLKSETRAAEYADEIVDAGSPVNMDLHFDTKEEYIYVMTETNVTRVKVQNCQRYEACNSCLSDGDPYCGWCSLEKKCMLKSECSNAEDLRQARWLHGPPNQCIYITSISPSTASVTAVEELHLTIFNLPHTSRYSCVYRELGWSTPADFWYFGARCLTPNFTDLGISLGNEGYRTITLALNSSETGKLFVTKEFTFYNCSNFNSCTSCTSSDFSCDWCIYDNGCYHDTMTCQPDIIRGAKSSKPGRRGSLHCPRIDTTLTGEIFLPANQRKAVLLKGFNFPELRPSHSNFKCVVNTGDRRYEAEGQMLNDRHITCSMPKMMYSQNQGILEAQLSVYWGNGFNLESTTPITVNIYKCEVLANAECGICLNLNYTQPQLECLWCGDDCHHSSVCPEAQIVSCPDPQILAVSPMSGPIQGGTNVTIEGRNLGTKFEDIVNAVIIAGVRCKPFRELYSTSRKIVCRTEWRGQEAAGPVQITIGSHTVEYDTDLFQFRSPLLVDLSPTCGPMSGGSRITITGHNLDTGRLIEAQFDDVPCIVDRSLVQSDSLICETSGVWTTGSKSPIRLYFDKKDFRLNRHFSYRDDPTITNIEPRTSTISGGRQLVVTGTNFECIQRPQMFAYIHYGDGQLHPTEPGTCQKVSDTTLRCPSPALPVSFIRQMRRVRRESEVVRVQLGFQMDGVLSVRDLSNVSSLDSQLTYFPNPVVYNFTEKDNIKIFKGEMLIIEGKDLTLGASKWDVQVLVGQTICNVTTFSSNQIVCQPPEVQPPGVSDVGKPDDAALPYVMVKINNAEFRVGQVEYSVPEQYSFPVEVIAGIAAGGGILIFIIIQILIIYRRQSTRAERIYRKLQIQLDNLESNVRNECKQAFAELQTDMTDLTGDLVASGIPFWDYHSYTFKVLFPGMSDHVILHPPLQKNGSIRFSDHGLQMFHALLSKKVFLLNFIRTLERQRGFNIRDKVNVASLLMIIYQNNMEYATDVLKSLLVELVEKSVAGRHPKLMLRRTESVVEKLLTNWLSLCMYKHLKEHAGSSLFMLYKAIKLQVEKGPVDYIMGDARYSLSEDKLLREKVEPRTLLVMVEHNGEVVQCRVLDCDIITQAKEKMMDQLYRNVPYSRRPHAHDLDLEWRNGPTGPVLLQDEDITSENRDGWKRLNTLSHYKLIDGAYMSLVHRQQTVKSFNGSLDNSVMSVSSGFPFMKTDSFHGVKVWHMTKHEDITQKDGGIKMISEIFLTRLLSTKGTLQKYIDDFFKTTLSVGVTTPPVIKYLFDFLDEAAECYGIADPDVIHTWKCNSLPLRFWVNIIKNPDFVFDIHKPHIVDSCLSVVAQTFMDSCSTSEHRLGKDSPSNKLLFAKDIVVYRKLVEKHFQDIQDMAPVSDQDMNSYLADVSRMSSGKFYISSALRELYTYVSKYEKELLDTLEQDNIAQAQQLAAKLGQVITAMEGPSSRIAYV